MCECMNCVSSEGILKELLKRANQDKINWEVQYNYIESKTRIVFEAKEEKFTASFSAKSDIEKNYMLHKVYKSLEPALLEARARANKVKQEEQQKELMDKLQTQLQKKKKKNSPCQRTSKK